MTSWPGKRIYPNDTGNLIFSEPGVYGRGSDGKWWARPPLPGFSAGILSDHQITEHEDGTITVSPSILVEGTGGNSWHGYLERGVWRKD